MKNIEIINDEIFKIGKYEFIKFVDDNGNITGVLKDSLGYMRFGDNNDFSKSDILKKLNKEFLPEIEKVVGAENVLEFETDLTLLDGSKKHGTMKSKVSLPTFDFYRNNRATFAKYKLDDWWWLATPHTTSEYANDWWVSCVSPRGDFYYICSFNSFGVRPFLTFVSTIFDSLVK
jgi:hypothetical protein